ncbi:MAG: hypothetical protein NZM04_02575 [Methylacidiphilales bacterium]|nr:hypothetical protein [Candidatus Methylacidiphilales bacterium]
MDVDGDKNISHCSVPVNFNTVRWACRRAGLSEGELAQKLAISESDLKTWEKNGGVSTWKQACQLADILHIPIGYLFIDDPSSTIYSSIEYFCNDTSCGQYLDNPDLEYLMNDVLYKCGWLSDYRRQEGYQPLDFIGISNESDDYKKVAMSIRQRLSLPNMPSANINNAEQYFKILRNILENNNIFVIVSSNVLGHHNWNLSKDKPFDFVVSDLYAPFIFINNLESFAKKTYALVSALAYLWLGKSSIIGSNGNNDIFHKIASEILLPENFIIKTWNENKSNDIIARIKNISKSLCVDSILVVNKLNALGIIDERQRQVFLQDIVHTTSSENQTTFNIEHHNDIYDYLIYTYGVSFTQSIIHGVKTGFFLYREAASLLNISLNELYVVIDKDDYINKGLYMD